MPSFYHPCRLDERMDMGLCFSGISSSVATWHFDECCNVNQTVTAGIITNRWMLIDKEMTMVNFRLPILSIHSDLRGKRLKRTFGIVVGVIE